MKFSSWTKGRFQGKKRVKYTFDFRLDLIKVKRRLDSQFVDSKVISYSLTTPAGGIYFLIYINNVEEAIMDTAKLFINGRSQAVRLPKAYRFEGNEVYIKKVAGGVLLISKDQSIWDLWERNLMKYEEPFMTERNQPELPQGKESLD